MARVILCSHVSKKLDKQIAAQPHRFGCFTQEQSKPDSNQLTSLRARFLGFTERLVYQRRLYENAIIADFFEEGSRIW